MVSNHFPNNDLMWFRQQNEERPEDWRWRRAIVLEERNADISNFEDSLVNSVRAYLHAVNQETPPDQLCADFPIMYEVARIYNSASNTRWLLEALIMGNVPAQDIADRFGWDGEQGKLIVDTYESVRFDIRGRLRFDGFIQSNILNINPGIIAPSEERIWKLLSYVGSKNNLGTKLLDYYISVDSMPDEVKKWYDNLIAAQLTKKTLRAIIRNDPMQSPLINELFATYYTAKKINIDEKMAGIGSVGSGETKVHDTLIKSLTLTTASITKQLSSGIEVRALDSIDLDIEKQLQQQVQDAAVKRIESTNKKVLPPVE